MSKPIYDRKLQGELIAQAKGLIKRLYDRNYVVYSQSGNGPYNVQLIEFGFVCSCADYVFRGVKCKHILSVEFSFVAASEQRRDIIKYMYVNGITLICF